MKNIYAISVENKETNYRSISSKAYVTLEEAQNFIENRGDKPKRIVKTFSYESNSHVYRIKFLYIK